MYAHRHWWDIFIWSTHFTLATLYSKGFPWRGLRSLATSCVVFGCFRADIMWNNKSQDDPAVNRRKSHTPANTRLPEQLYKCKFVIRTRKRSFMDLSTYKYSFSWQVFVWDIVRPLLAECHADPSLLHKTNSLIHVVEACEKSLVSKCYLLGFPK